jgi:putative transferase (TIGR04331 family)
MHKNLYIDYQQVRAKNFQVILDDYLVKDRRTLLYNKKYYQNLPNYFWDKQKVKQKDVLKIDKLKKEIFIYLVKKLEIIHSEKFTKKYWEIILLPWLDSIIPKIFHYWKITSSLDKKLFGHLYKFNGIDFIKNSFYEVGYYNNLDFNRWILSELIIYQNKTTYKQKKSKAKNQIQIFTKISFFKNILKSFFKFFSLFFNSRIMIDSIQISKLDYILLNLKLKQFPFFWFREDIKEHKIDFKKREKLSGKNYNKKNLSTFIKKNLIYLVPKNYLENFKSIKSSSEKNYWPKKPKIIITSLSYWFDDFFKIWVAGKTLIKTKYIIMQHGGKMATEKVSTNMSVQIQLADKYLTWGWNDKNKKVTPYFSMLLSNIHNQNNYIKKKTICFCQSVFPNYFNHIDGLPILFKDKITYTESANIIYEKLQDIHKKNFLLRFLKKQNDKVNSYHKLIINKNISHDDSKKKFQSLIKDVRIFIHNQDSTTFLETLAANVPTIVVLKKDYLNNIKSSSKKLYLALEKEKIIFHNSEKAAKFINLNYDKIDNWWESKSTQKAKAAFCKRFANKNENFLSELTNFLKNLCN